MKKKEIEKIGLDKIKVDLNITSVDKEKLNNKN